MPRLRYNGLTTTLGGSLSTGTTAVTFAAPLTHSSGTAVPTITGSDYIALSIMDSTGVLAEIVYLTAYTTATSTGTILRAQESTTAKTHASGALVVNGPTVLDVSQPLRLLGSNRITTTTTMTYGSSSEIPLAPVTIVLPAAQTVICSGGVYFTGSHAIRIALSVNSAYAFPNDSTGPGPYLGSHIDDGSRRWANIAGAPLALAAGTHTIAITYGAQVSTASTTAYDQWLTVLG